MERLTFDGNFCDIAQCWELPCPYNGACSQRKVWERLKAYENIGLEPAEVISMHGDWCAMMAALRSKDIDKLVGFWNRRAFDEK